MIVCSTGCGVGGVSSRTEESVSSKEETMYGSNYHSAMETPDDGYLYGMCYLAFEGVGNRIDYKKAFELMHNMGVQTIRQWMHFNYFMSDYQTFIPEKVELMHAILAEADRWGIRSIGMSHVNWSIDSNAFGAGKHVRQTWEGSNYYKWLECYEENWYQVVKEFPEITYWEIDNELNNKDFMFLEGHFGEYLTTEEMAAISADMLYYGSRGIHRANANAITVMGGIVDPWGLGKPQKETGTTMVNFMEALYDAIKSGEHSSYDPDDFFQVAAWHPYYYVGCADEYFVSENNKVYEVIKRREGKDKKVFLTEFGWNEYQWSMDNICSALENLFTVISKEMPYVENLCYFRAFDNVADNHNTAGLFYDPNPDQIDFIPDTKTRGTPGAPKDSAYAYQKATGAQGSLDILKMTLE